MKMAARVDSFQSTIYYNVNSNKFLHVHYFEEFENIYYDIFTDIPREATFIQLIHFHLGYKTLIYLKYVYFHNLFAML